MRSRYPEERGKCEINGHKMEWTFKRSKGESAFGIRASRIFELQILRDGVMTLEYGRGLSKKPASDDEETPLCLNHLINTYGRNKIKEKKDAGEN